MTEFGEMTLEMFDLKVLQLVLIVMASTLTCYLLIRMTLWLFDYLNTKFFEYQFYWLDLSKFTNYG